MTDNTPENLVPFQLPENTLILRETGYNVYRPSGEEVHGYVDQNNRYYERTQYSDGKEEWFIQEEEDIVGVPEYAAGDLIFAQDPTNDEGVRFSSLLGLIDAIDVLKANNE